MFRLDGLLPVLETAAVPADVDATPALAMTDPVALVDELVVEAPLEVEVVVVSGCDRIWGTGADSAAGTITGVVA